MSVAPILRMVGIGKSFPGVRALDDVSLEVFAGEVHALMGENGAGKSTLMKILSGAYTADEGDIYIDGKLTAIESPQHAMDLGIAIIYQEFNLVPQLTVSQNIFLGRELRRKVSRWVDSEKMNRETRRLMSDLGASVDPCALVSELPVALQQMVEIAKATNMKCRIIAMDEPSATLTEHELQNLYALIRRLKQQGVAIVYISHRMEEVFTIADRITVVRDGKTVGTRGRAEASREELIRMMVGRTLNETYAKETAHPGAPVLEVRGLTRRGAIENVSFTVHGGEIVALAGLVGAGRTEIARCIFGADGYDRGEIIVDGKPLPKQSPRKAIKARVGFVTEDRKGQGLVLDHTIKENATLAALPQLSRMGFVKARRQREAAVDSARDLDIRTPSIEQRVKNLSGGNQQKVVLAKWLETNSKLLILDEPTRGIDVGAKLEIYNLMNRLAAEGIGILMISSELPEVLGMADRIIVLREGRIVGELPRKEATQEKVGRLAIGA